MPSLVGFCSVSINVNSMNDIPVYFLKCCPPRSMMVELEDKVSQLESWTDGKGVVVVGAAGTFCSGSDLNAVRAISNPQVAQQRH